jgi:hypothetical protein
MEEKLKSAIERYQKAPTSLEAYKAISDFVELIMTVPEFIKQVGEEGEKIRIAQAELNADKGWNYGLRGRDLDEHNKRRGQKYEALFQLDPWFPLHNLRLIHTGIQPENIVSNTDWLFHRFGPDDPLPKADREECQLFIDKLYKKILPFLPKEDEKIKEEVAIVTEEKEEAKPLSFDEERSTLCLTGKEIKISIKQNDRTNGHYVLQHIFTAEEGLKQQYPYAEIAEDTFKSEYTGKNEWRKYHRACEDINKKARKQAGIDDFLIFTTGRTGWVKINEKYLE